MTPILALCALASLTPAETLVFQPEKGLVVEKTLHGASAFELKGWGCAMDGKPVPAQYLPKIELTVRESGELVVRDEHIASAGNRPTKLRREFVTVEALRDERVKVDAESYGGEREGSCAVESCVVLFDLTGAEPVRELEYGECDASELDTLAIDADFTAFLPPAGEPASWKAPAAALDLFANDWLGARVHFEPSEHDRPEDPAQLAANLTGEWLVARGDAREEDGRKVVPLTLEGEFESWFTVDSELRDVPVASGPSQETTRFAFAAKGELLWDVERRVLHSLALEASGTMTHRTETAAKGASGEPVYAQDMRFTGKMEIRVAARLAK